MRNKPIGVFDSGMGGLTVVSQIQRLLPNENIVYFGDTAHLPYGTKSKRQIIRFSSAAAKFLAGFKIKLLVVACNSSSSCALPALRRAVKIPILGVIAPGAEDAVRTSPYKRIGIIGTRATIESGAYQRKLIQLDPEVKVVAKACPLFVPLVEEGWVDHKPTLQVAREYLEPLKLEGIDTLILGCTHYPLLKDIIGKVMGESVRLVDPAQAVARKTREVLGKKEMLTRSQKKAVMKSYVSDWPQNFKKMGRRFLGERILYVKEVK